MADGPYILHKFSSYDNNAMSENLFLILSNFFAICFNVAIFPKQHMCSRSRGHIYGHIFTNTTHSYDGAFEYFIIFNWLASERSSITLLKCTSWLFERTTYDVGLTHYEACGIYSVGRIEFSPIHERPTRKMIFFRVNCSGTFFHNSLFPSSVRATTHRTLTYTYTLSLSLYIFQHTNTQYTRGTLSLALRTVPTKNRKLYHKLLWQSKVS